MGSRTGRAALRGRQRGQPQLADQPGTQELRGLLEEPETRLPVHPAAATPQPRHHARTPTRPQYQDPAPPRQRERRATPHVGDRHGSWWSPPEASLTHAAPTMLGEHLSRQGVGCGRGGCPHPNTRVFRGVTLRRGQGEQVTGHGEAMRRGAGTAGADSAGVGAALLRCAAAALANAARAVPS